MNNNVTTDMQPRFVDEAARSLRRSRGGGSLITVHGLLVLVDVDGLANFVTKTRLDISNHIIDKRTWVISESSYDLTI